MRTFFITFISCIILFACTKEYSARGGYNSLDTTWKVPPISDDAPVNLLFTKLQEPAQVDSFDIEQGDVLEFDNGLEIYFPAFACVDNGGTSLKGMAKVEVIFLREKGDFICYERPTTSNDYLLETGGALYLHITQNGVPLQLAPGAFVSIRYKESQPYSDMQVFFGDTTANNTGNFDWLPASQDAGAVYVWADSSTLELGYQLFSERLEWINCDYFRDSTITSTGISAKLPVNYTNNNTAVFLVFKELRAVVRLSANVDLRRFESIRIPIGSKVEVVSLSQLGDDLYMTTKDLTVSGNDAIELDPVMKTEAEIRDYLSGL